LVLGGEDALKLRKIATAVAVISSFALLTPAAHASGQVCYDVQVAVGDQSPVSQAGCIDLP
jgi:hypothetical protein